MDEINKNDIGNMLMNAEGTCPECGNRTTLLGGLFSAREAGIEDLGVCRCPQCHHIYRYELIEGALQFTQDITDAAMNPEPVSPQPDSSEVIEPEIIRPELDVEIVSDNPIQESETPQPSEIPEPEEDNIEFDADEDPNTYEDSIIEEIAFDENEEPLDKTSLSEDADLNSEEETAAETDDTVVMAQSEPLEELQPYDNAEMKVCPKCGKSIPAVARYCPYCRKNLASGNRSLNLKKYAGLGAIALLVIAVVTAAVIYFPKAARNRDYSEAMKLLKAGEYQQAADAFEQMGDYQKAGRYAKYCRGVLSFSSGDYEGARELFSSSGSVEDSQLYVSYLDGLDKVMANSLKASDYTSAADDFKKASGIADAAGMEKYCRALASFINGSSDSADQFRQVVSEASIPSSYLNRSSNIVRYIDAVTRLENGEMKALDDLSAVINADDAIINRKAGDYADYIEALNLYNEGKYYSASVIFRNLDILDSAEKAASCIQKRPSTGIVYRAGNSKSVSLTIYDTADSKDLYVKIYDKNDNLAETVYIRDGGKGTAYLASGSYRFALASGDGSKWYGTKETYGPDGIYQRLKVNNTNSEYYSLSSGSWQLKFNVSDGNVHSETTNYGDV